MTAWLTVLGIGDDGYAGLGKRARRALADAAVTIGAERHLAMLPAWLATEREPWPRPFDVAPLVARRPARVCVLASGDPMLFGVGATLAGMLAPHEWQVLPAPSSLSLAAARVGWALQDVDAISLVGRPLATLHRYLYPGRRLLVLSADGATPAAIAGALVARGFGPSAMSVLEHLGGPLERRVDVRADAWGGARAAALNLVAIECRAHAGAPRLALTPGLPDDAYRHDGQLTKRELRALALARLAPAPGELLWDVGAGCGSIGIEWMRAHPSCRAIAIEAHPDRQRLIEHNRDALGVPALVLVAGRAPDALAGLPAPDAVFVGGGVSRAGVLDACWSGLKPGGRLIAHAVTLQGEAALVAWRERHGGALTRVSIAHAQPLGGFDAWRQALPVTLYDGRKPCEESCGFQALEAVSEARAAAAGGRHANQDLSTDLDDSNDSPAHGLNGRPSADSCARDGRGDALSDGSTMKAVTSPTGMRAMGVPALGSDTPGRMPPRIAPGSPPADAAGSPEPGPCAGSPPERG